MRLLRQTGRGAQAYFYYDSKKAGSQTISHLRFGPERIEAPYYIQKANFVACHLFSYFNKNDVLEYAALVTGYHALLVVVAGLYGLAFLTGRRHLAAAAA